MWVGLTRLDCPTVGLQNRGRVGPPYFKNAS